jgi:hypothetical protein
LVRKPLQSVPAPISPTRVTPTPVINAAPDDCVVTKVVRSTQICRGPRAYPGSAAQTAEARAGRTAHARRHTSHGAILLYSTANGRKVMEQTSLST